MCIYLGIPHSPRGAVPGEGGVHIHMRVSAVCVYVF